MKDKQVAEREALSEVVAAIRECRGGIFTTTNVSSQDCSSRAKSNATEFPRMILDVENIENHYMEGNKEFPPELMMRPETLKDDLCVIITGHVEQIDRQEVVFLAKSIKVRKAGATIAAFMI